MLLSNYLKVSHAFGPTIPKARKNDFSWTARDTISAVSEGKLSILRIFTTFNAPESSFAKDEKEVFKKTVMFKNQ